MDSETEDENLLAEGDSEQLFQKRRSGEAQEGAPPADPTPGDLSEQQHKMTNQVRILAHYSTGTCIS